MNNKPYRINLNPIFYVSLYTPKKCKIGNYLLCIGLFKRFLYFNYKP